MAHCENTQQWRYCHHHHCHSWNHNHCNHCYSQHGWHNCNHHLMPGLPPLIGGNTDVGAKVFCLHQPHLTILHNCDDWLWWLMMMMTIVGIFLKWQCWCWVKGQSSPPGCSPKWVGPPASYHHSSMKVIRLLPQVITNDESSWQGVISNIIVAYLKERNWGASSEACFVPFFTGGKPAISRSVCLQSALIMAT